MFNNWKGNPVKFKRLSVEQVCYFLMIGDGSAEDEYLALGEFEKMEEELHKKLHKLIAEYSGTDGYSKMDNDLTDWAAQTEEFYFVLGFRAGAKFARLLLD